MNNFEFTDKFESRHIGPDTNEINEMCRDIGVNDLNDLVEKTLPNNIKLAKEELFSISEPQTEFEFLNRLKKIAGKNKLFRSFIGMGYYSTITPPVIQRNILENPGWYTPYTPYQAEISQGRLEALLNYQTMVADLTGMEISNASLLDEATAAAEAMSLFETVKKGDKKNSNVFLVSENCFPQTIEVLKTRAIPLGIELRVKDITENDLADDVYGMLVQYPDKFGEIKDYTNLFASANEKNILIAAASDLLSLTLLTPPGEFGADIVLGSAQRFGVPMGYGGPHAAFFATKEEFKRNIPGRLIGVSVDRHNKTALRMALQTREQHIKREKATSNICTAQVLLAIIAGMYAVYHGPKGLKNIAMRVNSLTNYLYIGIKQLGFKIINNSFFDTLFIETNDDMKQKIKEAALNSEINLNYYYDGFTGISLDESTTKKEVEQILDLLAKSINAPVKSVIDRINGNELNSIPENILRKSGYLTHPVFNTYHSETELMRYCKTLENKDISLTRSMISLGSCTMKLNAAAEMFGITYPEFAGLHPFIPIEQAEGYTELINELEEDLAKMTGFTAVSLQPNSGAQGEYTGLMVIREYHINNGEENRNVVLIPSSAHGTNPASAVMAGGKVVVVKCDDNGNIDLNDLKKKAEDNKENLSSLMVTYPSTHGVFEQEIIEICDIIHRNGGLVYMDGANLNAQLGVTTPGKIGADVCHLNLHKTFTIPHGGGGPGMGPIAVNDILKPFLPKHSIVRTGGEKGITSVSAAPYGSADILIISFAYIKMMGAEGLTNATKVALLNANYIKTKLSQHYKVLYTGKNGMVAHELIFDTRDFKDSTDVGVEDIAKRLIDYGYHAPTVSFPVPGTMMVEPTESESKDELDKFIEAMISIREEIREIEQGIYPKDDNVLINAPHTAEDVISDKWEHSYSREKATFPLKWVRNNKYWPVVGRINNVYGDRNLMCSCIPVSEYEEQEDIS